MGILMAKEQKALGRPPRHKGERLSKNRTFRVRGDLDEQLQAAANVSGRSVSEEIEYRLKESFRRLDDVLGGAHNTALFRHVAGVIGIIESKHGKRWDQDLTTQREIAIAMMGVFAESGADDFKFPFGVLKKKYMQELANAAAAMNAYNEGSIFEYAARKKDQ
jgi:hypothetical protein